jgi:flavin reductase (DIM6/NTAB) family NADH-FMN oxidoreductase RutF
MVHHTEATLKSLERFYRANLVNGLTGYKPAMLIGTKSMSGTENLALFSSVVHLGADPALIGYIQRPVGQSGDTFRNIEATGFYTINHVHASFAEQAHYTSARFKSDVSEFDACKLTPEYIRDFHAPFVMESHVKIGLELVEVMPIRHNDTKLVIGKVVHILLDPDCVKENGDLDLSVVNDLCVSGLENYHQPALLTTYPYAKVEELPKF